ncbi:hypothetical protein A8C56_13405 [Niabella ginsenosidivorans]|uniref:RNA polymerase sigma-70 factor n=1 Tax=Niabella ginsenosidivorans TaxID=1176587 RepID=A0A1A9I596_9BACT|nr:RNA polymerase sigma-70 factor [Niabella ginsenosidivorans]ANH81841.1 hypothetical protein A8C56_13405 [Niabella ginsenosidivorans]
MHNDELHNGTNSSDDLLEALFNELFREYESKLYAFSVKMLKSDALAKDIIQEVFLKLWTIRNQIPEINNISSFLYRITENKILDYLRAAASDQKKKDALWKRTDPVYSADPRNDLEAKEFHQVIHQAIQHLSPQRRSVYLMSKVDGLQRNQIAALMNVSPHTVKNQLAKAVQQILHYVKKHSG